MDDIVIAGKMKVEHDANLQLFLTVLHPSACRFQEKKAFLVDPDCAFLYT